jgi:eukaryotic-like serine/threonine-protein kinase
VQRYTLLREVASGLAFLHKHGVCVGDISPKNLLFSLSPHEAVYFIDCDAMRINGVSALPQVETPGWDTPSGEELATIYSDAYKLGLLGLRLLAGDQHTSNPQHVPASTPALLRQVITDTLTNPPATRPLPEAWTYVLGHAIEKAQHQKLSAPKVGAPVSATPAPPPIPVVHSRPPAQSGPPSRPPAPPPTPSPYSGPPVSPWTPPASQPAASKAPSKAPIWVALAVLAVALTIVGVVVAIAPDKGTNGGTATSTYPSNSPTYSSIPGTTRPLFPSYKPPYIPTPTTSTPPPDVYIAIASAQPDGWGWATSTVSSDDAVAKAIAKCAEVNTGCKWSSWNRNGCVAIAKANNGDIWGGHGSSQAEAEQDALAHGGRVLKSVCA